MVDVKAEIWCIGLHDDDEHLTGNFANREEAIAEGHAEYDPNEHEAFYVYRCENPDPYKFMPSALTIIEMMAETAYDECGELTEDWPDADKAAKDDLEHLLAFWSRKYAKPSFWMAVGNPERIETKKP